MWFGVVTLFPEDFRHALDFGVVGRAIREESIRLDCFNPREFTTDRHRTVDDRPYGGGAGMLMMVEPVLKAVEAARNRALDLGVGEVPIRVMSPRGPVFTQRHAASAANGPGLVLIALRYEGIDERLFQLISAEPLSIGDFVLSGGELPALCVVDAISRLLPGVLGNASSKIDESHLDGLLEYPQYTRPENVGGLEVPASLLSGNHQAISLERRRGALAETYKVRPEMLNGRLLMAQDRLLLKSLLDEEAGP